MGTRIYVGNLSYDTGEAGLRSFFEQGGCTVTDIHIVTDRETGRPRGFAFIEVGDDAQLRTAIETLDGRDLDGRRISVSEARPRAPRGDGPGGGPRRSGNGAPYPPRDRPQRDRPPPGDRPPPRDRPPRSFGPGGGGGPPRAFDGGFAPPPAFGSDGVRDQSRKKKNKLRRPHDSEDDGGGRGGGGRPRGGKRRRRDDDFDW